MTMVGLIACFVLYRAPLRSGWLAGSALSSSACLLVAAGKTLTRISLQNQCNSGCPKCCRGLQLRKMMAAW